MEQKEIIEFFELQLAEWPEVKARFAELQNVVAKDVDLSEIRVKVTHNPARIRSSAAKVDKKSIAERPCFLCDKNRPAEQHHLDWRGYKILVNPYPILPQHFTIVAKEHRPQNIADAVADMTSLAKMMPDFAIFYNGPACGASAPDHFHFQAVRRDALPMYNEWDRPAFPMGYIALTGDKATQQELDKVMRLLPREGGEIEAKVNIYCTMRDGEPEIIILPRRKHRPDFYGEEGMLVSPASIDLAGVMVAARKSDFDKFNVQTITEIYHQLCYTQQEIDIMMSSRPTIAVGLMTAKKIGLKFIKGFGKDDGHELNISEISAPLRFNPEKEDSLFELTEIKIGIGFHWEQTESQQFRGGVELVPVEDGIVVINHIDIEEYLKSVISSEMKSTSPIEFLKAHAVISRSWLMQQIGRREEEFPKSATYNDSDEIIRWYDREDHKLFDVCADDHCQRYQGVTRMTCGKAIEAVEATSGMVLMDNSGEIADARFSKCCGGATEEFDTCWGKEEHPYLKSFRDILPQSTFADLTIEANAKEWIMHRPKSFCDTTDEKLLSEVLNNFDRSTKDFYRWEVSYTSTQLREIILRKTGIDMGNIENLEPIERGKSGRISKLKISGALRTITIGKELEIRRWLSESHLYSSAFVVEKEGKIDDGDKKITTFTLRGAGWGHGVGLCQIGAAAMSQAGYGYNEILAHYYPGTTIEKIYE